MKKQKQKVVFVSSFLVLIAVNVLVYMFYQQGLIEREDFVQHEILMGPFRAVSGYHWGNWIFCAVLFSLTYSTWFVALVNSRRWFFRLVLGLVGCVIWFVFAGVSGLLSL